MTHRSRRRLPVLLGAVCAVTAGLAIAQPTVGHAAANASSKVAYITDYTTGSNGGYNLFQSFGIAAPGSNTAGQSGPYSTLAPAAALTVTVTNIDVSSLTTTTALSGYDTAVLFEACNIGSDPNFMKAINTFVDGGGKLIIMDGAQCVNGNGGNADFSKFEQPFSDSYLLPDPHDPQGTPVAAKGYTYVEPNPLSTQTLTNHQPDCGSAPCNEPGNAITDASILNPKNGAAWCVAASGTDTNGVSGAIEAYTRSTKVANTTPGLVVYEGEAFAATNNNTTPAAGFTAIKHHLRLVFDSFLTQQANPDTLPCLQTDAPQTNVPEAPLGVLIPGIGLIAVAGFALTVARRRRRQATAA